MFQAAAWALLASSSLVLGAFVALRFTISKTRVGQAMGFGAGALVGSLAYELIPHANVDDLVVWLSFGAGAILFFVADGLVEKRFGDGGGTGIALGALLDGVPESVVLGMGLAVGGSISVGFLVAVFVSNVPESLSSAGAMRAEHPPAAIYRLWIAIAAASAVAGGLGYVIANALPAVDGAYVQAFAGGAVLTMLADSMFPGAYEDGGRTVGLLTALGFAMAALLTTFD
jgi:ZIP family zinc transporter